jgi:Lrp/AsnC family transcriptional regulator for asnA, asnC and gidA
MKTINHLPNIDGIDKIIIKALMQDARTPILQIAKQVGISGAAIHPRIKKLEENKILNGSKYVLNVNILGYKTLSFVGIYLDRAADNQRAVKALEGIPEVLECYYTTGNWSILVKIICFDNEHLMQILNKKIQQIDGVSRTETFISLEQQIDRQLML